MKHLTKFSLFEEVNPRDIAMIESDLNDYFTISFEFEIETKDKTHIKTRFKDIDDDAIDDIEETVISDFKIRKKSEKELVSNLMIELQELIYDKELTIESFEKLFDLSKYVDMEREIVQHIKRSIVSYVFEEDYKYLRKKVQENLPNFYKKWNNRMDYVGDASLDRGIEIKPKTYTKSLSEAIELLNDFYSDFKQQSYWNFTDKTGLHINIGSNKKVEWNPIKGLLILNDFNEDKDKVPYTFKDMTWRLNNTYCGSFLPHIKSITKKQKSKLKSSVDLHNLKEAEGIINKFLDARISKVGFKNFGFNITKLSYNYVEFRYAGGIIPKDVLIEKVKYFALVVYAMTNPEYKKREYLKKLYKFIDNL